MIYSNKVILPVHSEICCICQLYNGIAIIILIERIFNLKWIMCLANAVQY